MSKKKNKCCCKKERCECCCCEPCSEPCCCCESNKSSCSGSGALGGTCAPIIFLLIACGSGLLNCNKSYLIILLFILCGGNFSSILGGQNSNTGCNSCC